VPELGELVECSAVDCSNTFIATRRHAKWCSPVCRTRMARWRRFGRPKQRLLYADALAGVDLRELREQAVAELIHGAITGAPPPHPTKVAGLALACDKRLERAR
jgi:hypothetical protein